MANRYLFLIRNGQYENSDDGMGAPLTEIGQKQARLTAVALRDFPIHAVYCSPHLQVVETADIIATPHNLRPQQTKFLRQYDTPPMDGDTLHPDVIRQLFSAQRKQIEDAYAAFFRPSVDEVAHDIIVCHGTLIRDLICRALNVNPEAWAHMLINHCGISAVQIDDNGEIQLVNYNDVHHLPDPLRTSS